MTNSDRFKALVLGNQLITNQLLMRLVTSQVYLPKELAKALEDMEENAVDSVTEFVEELEAE